MGTEEGEKSRWPMKREKKEGGETSEEPPRWDTRINISEGWMDGEDGFAVDSSPQAELAGQDENGRKL